ncbi:O-antigen ligase family protein [Corallococcus sp. M34]|uniref:O-antigen ligase family protein n=1 Tax=Citreicoccus inhibens TaxID=2849499 RepID=UPI001C24EEFE|nr:O-antigen ligase family protein [Citreicoccus inhibens]MBU8895375.1 O-antigen ligase family protein [Citreicoccus inhibens]
MTVASADAPRASSAAGQAGTELAGAGLVPGQLELVLLGSALLGTALLIGVDGLETSDRFFLPKRLVLGGVATLLGLRWLVSRRAPPGLDTSFVAWGGVLGVSLASVVFGSVSLPLGFERLASDASALVIAMSAARIAGHDRGRNALVALLTWAAVLVAMVALLEALGLALPWGEIRRPASTLGGRNQVAGFVALILPLAVARFSRGGERAWGVSAVILGTVVVLTRCRSVWLGLGIAVLMVGVSLLRAPLSSDLRSRVLRGVWVCAASVGLAVLIPWPGLQWKESRPFADSLARLVEYDQGSGRYRIEQAQVSWAIVSSAPLLGVGLTGWGDASSRYAHSAGLHPPPYGDGRAPRSELLRVLVETGLLGFVAMLGWAWRVARRGRTDGARVPGLGAAFMVLATHALFDQPLLHAEQLAALGVLVGFSVAGARPLAIPVAGRKLVLAGLMLLVVGGTGALGRYYWIAVRGPTRALVSTGHVEALARVALRLTRGRDCEAAAPLLDRAVADAPHLIGLLCLSARCAEARGDVASAREFALRADAVEPHLAARLGGSTTHDCVTVLRLLESAKAEHP